MKAEKRRSESTVSSKRKRSRTADTTAGAITTSDSTARLNEIRHLLDTGASTKAILAELTQLNDNDATRKYAQPLLLRAAKSLSTELLRGLVPEEGLLVAPSDILDTVLTSRGVSERVQQVLKREPRIAHQWLTDNLAHIYSAGLTAVLPLLSTSRCLAELTAFSSRGDTTTFPLVAAVWTDLCKKDQVGAGQVITAWTRLLLHKEGEEAVTVAANFVVRAVECLLARVSVPGSGECPASEVTAQLFSLLQEEQVARRVTGEIGRTHEATFQELVDAWLSELDSNVAATGQSAIFVLVVFKFNYRLALPHLEYLAPLLADSAKADADLSHLLNFSLKVGSLETVLRFILDQVHLSGRCLLDVWRHFVPTLPAMWRLRVWRLLYSRCLRDSPHLGPAAPLFSVFLEEVPLVGVALNMAMRRRVNRYVGITASWIARCAQSLATASSVQLENTSPTKVLVIQLGESECHFLIVFLEVVCLLAAHDITTGDHLGPLSESLVQLVEGSLPQSPSLVTLLFRLLPSPAVSSKAGEAVRRLLESLFLESGQDQLDLSPEAENWRHVAVRETLLAYHLEAVGSAVTKQHFVSFLEGRLDFTGELPALVTTNELFMKDWLQFQQKKLEMVDEPALEEAKYWALPSISDVLTRHFSATHTPSALKNSLALRCLAVQDSEPLSLVTQEERQHWRLVVEEMAARMKLVLALNLNWTEATSHLNSSESVQAFFLGLFKWVYIFWRTGENLPLARHFLKNAVSAMFDHMDDEDVRRTRVHALLKFLQSYSKFVSVLQLGPWPVSSAAPLPGYFSELLGSRCNERAAPDTALLDPLACCFEVLRKLRAARVAPYEAKLAKCLSHFVSKETALAALVASAPDERQVGALYYLALVQADPGQLLQVLSQPDRLTAAFSSPLSHSHVVALLQNVLDSSQLDVVPLAARVSEAGIPPEPPAGYFSYGRLLHRLTISLQRPADFLQELFCSEKGEEMRRRRLAVLPLLLQHEPVTSPLTAITCQVISRLRLEEVTSDSEKTTTLPPSLLSAEMTFLCRVAEQQLKSSSFSALMARLLQLADTETSRVLTRLLNKHPLQVARNLPLFLHLCDSTLLRCVRGSSESEDATQVLACHELDKLLAAIAHFDKTFSHFAHHLLASYVVYTAKWPPRPVCRALLEEAALRLLQVAAQQCLKTAVVALSRNSLHQEIFKRLHDEFLLRKKFRHKV